MYGTFYPRFYRLQNGPRPSLKVYTFEVPSGLNSNGIGDNAPIYAQKACRDSNHNLLLQLLRLDILVPDVLPLPLYPSLLADPRRHRR